MKGICGAIIALAACVGSGAAAAADDTLYVQSVKAAILAKPAFDAATVAEVARGDQVKSVDRQDGWVEVELGEQRGWMPKLILSSRPPLSGGSVFTGKAQVLEQKARLRASNATTAGAARGLNADERRRAADEGMANYMALEQMEEITTDPADAIAFVRKGVGR